MKLPAWFLERSPLERAVLVLYAIRAVLGWLVALPLIRVVGESGVALLPHGDARLFQSGALWLTELLRIEERALRAGLLTSVGSALVALVVLSVPSALLFATAPRAMERAPAWPRALAIAPRFLVIGVLEMLAIGGILVVLAIASSSLTTSAGAWFDERGQDLAALVFCVPGILAAGFAAIVADVARLSLVREELPVMPAISKAIPAVRDAAGPLFGGFALATGTSVLLVALAARATALCRVEEPGTMRVLAVLLIHQAVLFALVVVQAGWVRRMDRVIP